MSDLKKLESILSHMIETPMGRRSFLASIPFLMAACASGEKTRMREGDNSGQATSLTVNDEVNMTKEVLPQMRKEYPPLKNPELQNYVNEIGFKVVNANKLQNNPYNYSFTVVDVPYVNAFALPAGTVFVTAPLIAMADSEAELAGVVGHEIGHIKARHTAERIEVAKQEQGKTKWYAIGGGLIGAAAGYGLGKMICPPKDNECLAKAAGYGAAAGAGGGLLIQKFGFMANSREDEMEADRIGFKTSVAAGYDKEHVGRFYEKLLKMEQQNQKGQNTLMKSLADALSTHPPSPERVNQMHAMAQESRVAAGVVNTKAFDKAKRLAAEFSRKAQERAKG